MQRSDLPFWRLTNAPARTLLLWVLVLALPTVVSAVHQSKRTRISSASVKLPPVGATQAEAYLIIDNPTAYDVYLQTPSSDAAGRVEFRTAGKPEPLEFLLVPAYNGLEMNAKDTYLLLRDLKKPLTEGATVRMSVTTDSGSTMTVEATVQKE